MRNFSANPLGAEICVIINGGALAVIKRGSFLGFAMAAG
jgi:hypothetical protein